jgi:hypothetical protein
MEPIRRLKLQVIKNTKAVRETERLFYYGELLELVKVMNMIVNRVGLGTT